MYYFSQVGKSKISIEKIKKKIIEEGEKLLEEQNEKIAENENRSSVVRAQGVKTKSNFNKNRVHNAHVDLQVTLKVASLSHIYM